MKKATMKDIASRANVSVATVSYVLNHVKNQTIPALTRESILQIAKELNYVPNLAARSLVKQRTGLAGILINKSPGQPYWSRQNYLSLVESLESKLAEAGYHTLLVGLNALSPEMDIIRERRLDAVFVFDVRDDMFYRISSNFVEGVPLILIGSLIEDPLFNQVNYDFAGALKQALHSSDRPACLIMERYQNTALTEWIIRSSGLSGDHICIVEHARAEQELQAFLERHREHHVIVINEFLAAAVEKLGEASSITVLCTCGVPEILQSGTAVIQFQNDRAAAAFERMELLLDGRAISHASDSNKFWVEIQT